MLVMTLQSWDHTLWTETSLPLVLAAPLGAIWLGIIGCVRDRLRHCGTRMILREGRSGSRVTYIDRRGMAAVACMVEVGFGPVGRPSVPILPPAWELPAV